MARYIGPTLRLSRREGQDLFLKGLKPLDKCDPTKKGPPGQKHPKMRTKMTNYGLQLREKQKVKRMYGLLEKQFRIFFKKAERARGVTGEILLQLLERRLDNLIYRSTLAPTRQAARQLVNHGHVLVNDKKVDIASYLVTKDETITLKVKDSFLKQIKENSEIVRQNRETPDWISVDFENTKVVVKDMPRREHIAADINEQLIVELYSK